jgi:hypothetical protein
MAWPLCGVSGSQPRAEQRESKLVGEVGVCAKALQQRAVLVGKLEIKVVNSRYRISADVAFVR